MRAWSIYDSGTPEEFGVGAGVEVDGGMEERGGTGVGEEEEGAGGTNRLSRVGFGIA